MKKVDRKYLRKPKLKENIFLLISMPLGVVPVIMNSIVYPYNIAGDYFNANFISLKFKIDVNKKDTSEVETWCKNTKAIHVK